MLVLSALGIAFGVYSFPAENGGPRCSAGQTWNGETCSKCHSGYAIAWCIGAVFAPRRIHDGWLGGGNWNIFLGSFSPRPLEKIMIQFDKRAYFSNGLVKNPPTRMNLPVEWDVDVKNLRLPKGSPDDEMRLETCLGGCFLMLPNSLKNQDVKRTQTKQNWLIYMGNVPFQKWPGQHSFERDSCFHGSTARERVVEVTRVTLTSKPAEATVTN